MGHDPWDVSKSKRRRSSPFNACDDSELKRRRIATTQLLGPTIDEESSLQTACQTPGLRSHDTSALSAKSQQTAFSDTEKEAELTVCFGMVNGVSGVCQTTRSSPLPEFPVTLTDPQHFESSDVAPVKGQIDPGFTYITYALLDEQNLELEITCSLETGNVSKARSARPLSTPCRLNIVLYGDISLLEQVGSFFEEHDLYLQDPLCCSRNVLYRNPHKLCDASGHGIWTSDLGREHAKSAIIETTQPRPELIDILNSQEDLVTAQQPGSIRSTMKSHQLQALTFMLQREQGWAWDGSRPDLWEFCPESTGSYYLNRVSGAAQVEEPPQFYGGIIADSMGLGKTLSMISLIASDLLLNIQDPSSITGANAEESSGRTLIVVPPPLLDAWEEQLKQLSFVA